MKAKEGQRVEDKWGQRGTIISIVSFVAEVKWFDGTHSKVPTSSIYRIGGPRWPIYLALALALGLTIGVSVWLS